MTATLQEDGNIFWSFLAMLFLEWEMFQTKPVEKMKTHILCLIIFFENSAVYEITWKNLAEPWQATEDNMPQVHYMLDVEGYKQSVYAYVILLVHGNNSLWTRLKVTL